MRKGGREGGGMMPRMVKASRPGYGLKLDGC